MPALDAGAGQEAREGAGVVVAALRAGAVGPRRAAELGADRHQRLAPAGPRCFRSLISAASGRSTRAPSADGPACRRARPSCRSSPVSISSTTRTPRSTSRRAIRHCQANDVRVAARDAVELPASPPIRARGRTTSGASRIMPRATRSSSMRARRFRSPGRARGVPLVDVAQHELFQLAQRHRAGRRRRSGIGSGPGMIRTPWWIGGRKLLSHTCVPA